ncbi:hypothetical protein [Streptomyces reniochalinae]|uniref:DUF308 domain-containing protein n=1 Tax=Streptomyces reniochalinae TaxID=2250578 RepID=A0A367EG50_9ACTN|nr:hypothetical protein [Streptomyces reniochalinae]RCG16625.1 hypothetical protein DQ392_21145 [Streptomyces reniochalinae]
MTGREPEEGEPREDGSPLPPEEEAAWAAIVAAYGEEPTDPEPGPRAGLEPDPPGGPGGDESDTLTASRPAQDKEPPDPSAPQEPPGPQVRSFTVYAAGTGPAGPRDWETAEEEGEGHFEPPEPPPLPETDVATKFAWLAAVGGPLLLLGAILLQADLTWWIVTLGVGGFLGGFATLLTRLRDGRDDDDWDDPGRGAVV